MTELDHLFQTLVCEWYHYLIQCNACGINTESYQASAIKAPSNQDMQPIYCLSGQQLIIHFCQFVDAIYMSALLLY